MQIKMKACICWKDDSIKQFCANIQLSFQYLQRFTKEIIFLCSKTVLSVANIDTDTIRKACVISSYEWSIIYASTDQKVILMSSFFFNRKTSRQMNCIFNANRSIIIANRTIIIFNRRNYIKKIISILETINQIL